MNEDEKTQKLEEAYQDFVRKIEEAKKTYYQKLDKISFRMDEIKIKQIKDKLR
jgi:predicted DNA binding CopG/RHH family protein